MIEVKGIDFAYLNSAKALENVNFTIKTNETTALVGLSGAGKSIIINLLNKLYQPTKGNYFTGWC